jgi:hypothetical protein
MCFGLIKISRDIFLLIPILFKVDGTLNGFTLRDGEKSGGKCVPNACKVISGVIGHDIISLHPTLPDTSIDRLDFAFSTTNWAVGLPSVVIIHPRARCASFGSCVVCVLILGRMGG